MDGIITRFNQWRLVSRRTGAVAAVVIYGLAGLFLGPLIGCGQRGTEEGTVADLVILDTYPLKVEPEALWDIEVIETIKEGESAYSKQELQTRSWSASDYETVKMEERDAQRNSR